MGRGRNYTNEQLDEMFRLVHEGVKVGEVADLFKAGLNWTGLAKKLAKRGAYTLPHYALDEYKARVRRCPKCGKRTLRSLHNRGNCYCKACSNKASTDYREKNKEKVKQALRKRRSWFVELRKTLNCLCCGEARWQTLAFHHKTPSEKSGEVSVMFYGGAPRQKVLDEIAKCDVLCFNCHRVKHWEEKNTHPSLDVCKIRM